MFRRDANVSVRKKGAEKYGTRAEPSLNLNSFRFAEKAINHEVARQIELTESGGTVVQETRLYDADKDETRSMRSKEEANDYRYFPDLTCCRSHWRRRSSRARHTPPELPDAKLGALPAAVGLRAYDAGALIRERGDGRLLRDGCRESGQGPEARGQLGHGRARRAEQGRARPASRIDAAGLRGLCRAHRRRHHLRQDREGSLETMGRRAQRRRRHRGERSGQTTDLRQDREASSTTPCAANPSSSRTTCSGQRQARAAGQGERQPSARPIRRC